MIVFLKKSRKPRAFFLALALAFPFFLICMLGGCASRFEPGTPPLPMEDAEERPGLFSGEKGKFEFEF